MTLNDQVKAAVEGQWKTIPHTPMPYPTERKLIGLNDVLYIATRIVTLCREDAQRREEEAHGIIMAVEHYRLNNDAPMAEPIVERIAAYLATQQKKPEGETK